MNILSPDFGYFTSKKEFIFELSKIDKLLRYIENGMFDKQTEDILIRSLAKVEGLSFCTQDKIFKTKMRIHSRPLSSTVIC